MFSTIVMALASRGLCLIATCVLAFAVAAAAGDPTTQVLDPRADAAERQALRKTLALDRPLPLRLVQFIGSAIHGDLGRSWQTGEPVRDMIADAAAATLDLAIAALFVSLALAIPLAAISASRPSSFVSIAIRRISLALVALPTFVTAIGLMAVFSGYLGLLPAFGRGTTCDLLGWHTGLVTLSGLRALLLPILTVAIALTGLFIHIIDNELRSVLQQDYIVAARARGTGSWRLYLHHALANAWPPLIASASIQFGNLIAFALVTETIFQRPGLGLICFRAMENADIPVITGLLLLAGVVFAACGFVADLLLARVDPRTRHPTHVGSPP